LASLACACFYQRILRTSPYCLPVTAYAALELS
jgi:hypothetical protein